jgi:benzoyl-CoA reductase/2-hydroxyglutaryl-CoA dehydratase subunit BcrC/BadD/HgdB
LGKVGFTTSIPIEVLYAADKTPIDLNNIFITHPRASKCIQEAERQGFPRTCCAWVKGIYAITKMLALEEVVAVVRGDCSNSQALMEILQMEGIPVYAFAYPYDRFPGAMELELRKIQEHYKVDEGAVMRVKKDLDRIRCKLKAIDVLTWKDGLVWGSENHAFLIASSDMRSDPGSFERELDHFLKEVKQRALPETRIRLGYIGVPPIYPDLFSYVEREDIRIVYNEVQRQFSMPYLCSDLVGQYIKYTYPYDIFYRLQDIEKEIQKRRIHGVIHYVQAFCFRQIEDRIIRAFLKVPVLTLEGDIPEPLDARTKLRIEAFLEMLGRGETKGITM